ncbi:MAG: hypothetical protein KDA95_02060 [Acidimicrobiales bacterium]|nr:hypothetical protein [Acidimicrobiales bacterium]
MAGNRRGWTNRWRGVLNPDTDFAAAEGLAAGTGILTGTVARSARRGATQNGSLCPSCDDVSEIVMVDLVAGSTTLRCTRCTKRWSMES